MKKQSNLLFIPVAICLLALVPSAYAAKDFNIKNNASSFFFVSGTSGNVGVGSITPGQLLDVQGTVRMTGFVMTTSPSSGYALTSDANGNGSWVANPASAGWTLTGSNVYTTVGSNNVGIGTSTPQGGFVVTNGNVGIGTWSPVNALSVAGNVTIGGGAGYLSGTNAAPGNGLIVQGDVGIGTFSPTSGVEFQVQGAQNTSVFRIARFGGSNYFYIEPPVEPSVGIGTTAIAGVSGTNIMGWRGISNSVVIGKDFIPTSDNGPTNGLTVEGNVGFGTDIPANQLVVNGGIGIGTGSNSSYLGTIAPSGGMIVQGSVGIGTYAPTGALEIEGGNVGIGTAFTTTSALSIMNGNVGIGTWVPFGTFALQSAASGSVTNHAACWTTNGTIGYCTGTINSPGAGQCATCTAL